MRAAAALRMIFTDLLKMFTKIKIKSFVSCCIIITICFINFLVISIWLFLIVIVYIIIIITTIQFNWVEFTSPKYLSPWGGKLHESLSSGCRIVMKRFERNSTDACLIIRSSNIYSYVSHSWFGELLEICIYLPVTRDKRWTKY